MFGEMFEDCDNNIGTNRYIQNITNGVATPFQLAQKDTNKLLTNKGATAEVYINLPLAPVVGQSFEAICIDADNMRLIAQGDQTIRMGSSVSIAAGYCQLEGIGSAVEIVYIDTNVWIVIDSQGTVNIQTS